MVSCGPLESSFWIIINPERFADPSFYMTSRAATVLYMGAHEERLPLFVRDSPLGPLQ